MTPGLTPSQEAELRRLLDDLERMLPEATTRVAALAESGAPGLRPHYAVVLAAYRRCAACTTVMRGALEAGSYPEAHAAATAALRAMEFGRGESARLEGLMKALTEEAMGWLAGRGFTGTEPSA